MNIEMIFFPHSSVMFVIARLHFFCLDVFCQINHFFLPAYVSLSNVAVFDLDWGGNTWLSSHCLAECQCPLNLSPED